MPINSPYLYAYGTLRSNNNNEMRCFLAQNAELVGDASFQGKLYKIDYYPGVVPSDNPADSVKGEVYRLIKPEYTLPQLDRYEECGTDFAAPTEYIREIRNVTLNSGETVPAWVYLYNRPTEHLAFLPSGDFLNDGSA